MATYHVTERDAGIGRKFVDERVIMSREQRATLDRVAQLTYDSAGDGVAVMRGSTSTYHKQRDAALTVTSDVRSRTVSGPLSPSPVH